jgi:hypothetical protein
MRKVLAVGLLALAACGGGERSSLTAQNIVVKQDPSVTVNEQNNTVCVSGEFAGLGMDNVNVDIDLSFAATTVCRNNGGNIAPGQGTISLTRDFPTQSFEPDKNGRLRFTACTDPIRGSDFPTPTSQQAGCPNGNWTVDPIQTSAITIASYSVDVSWRNQTLFTSTGP